MPQISLKINERHYDMTCDEGQEAHLSKLAGHLDERIQDLVGAVGQVGEGRLLVMASLLVADELFEAYKEIHALKAGNGAATGDGAGDTSGDDAEEVAALESCAQRIETIAARLAAA